MSYARRYFCDHFLLLVVLYKSSQISTHVLRIIAVYGTFNKHIKDIHV